MSKELISKLQPFVNTFSEALKTKYKHGDQVVVGGVIKEIFHMNNFLPEGSEDQGVYLKLDDGIGYNYLTVPDIAFQQFVKDHDLKEGSLVLAEGRLFTVNTTHTYELEGKTITTDKHEYETTRILCWEIAPLPDKIESTNKI
jgi:hypothetical protein